MKIKALLSTLLVMFATIATMAQVESGKVYRIVNKLYGSYAFESAVDNTVKCSEKTTSTDYDQFWIITNSGVESNYTIKNVYTGRYLCFEQNTNQSFKTLVEPTYLYINDNSNEFAGCYTFTAQKQGTWGMHCDGSSKCVPWHTNAEGTNWTFQEVNITAEEIAAAQEIYKNFFEVINNESNIAAAFEPFFEDKACTVLKAEYAAMSDDELKAAMAEIPADLQAIALKVKNNSWNTEKREKEFRIYDYKPYSHVDKWDDILDVRLYSPLDNPTGICTADNKSYTYVFVNEVPEGTTIELSECFGTGYFGTNTTLHQGLNIVPAALTDGFLYIRYICDTDTSSTGKKLADYPAVKIHIENGYINGFWSKERGHNNSDWAYMQEYMFENEGAIQVKGDLALLNFRKKEFLANCPVKITETIGLWDTWNRLQQRFMAVDKYYDWFNNLQLAMSDDSGFMDAGNHRTHYNNNTLNTIVNYDLLIEDAGSTWGPNHEIGHNNQYAFEIVGTSEVSNNALANMVIFEIGTHTSRGNTMENQILDFENKVPYVVRGEKEYGSKLFSMTRMYFQLFLYTYAAGKCPDFYPQLFERLRKDRLVGWRTRSQCAGTGDCSDDPKDANGYVKGSMDAKNDQLKFAEICCDILQMDLSEFFEAWGFFIPMKNAYVGDYGHHHVYLHQEDIDASRARMQKYEKKGGHLMFLEDRIRPSKRKDGNGYRADYSNEVPVGSAGDYGQWEDYIDESVKAQGYYYTSLNGKINIVEAEGAGGALGFKLYNADTDELLTFTNSKSMTIPANARTANLKVVAAQADGTDAIVLSAAEGPEEMQKKTLENSIKQAQRITKNVTKNGNEVGKYYPEITETLVKLVEEAIADSAKAAVHSWTEWSSMLDEEYKKILNRHDARIILKEGHKFFMRNADGNRYFTWSAGGAIGGASKTDDVFWEIEYAGEEGLYYIKSCSQNLYIKEFTTSSIAANGYTTSDALKFRIDYTDNGRTYFTLSTNDNAAIGFNGSNTGVSLSPTETAGQWAVRIEEDNSAEFESQKIAELMDKSLRILIEVSDTIELEKGDTVTINKNVESKNILLQDYVKALYDTYKNVQNNYDKVDEYYYYINDLRKALGNINGTYFVKAPMTANNGYFYWYIIRSEITNKIWNADSQKRIDLVSSTTNNITDENLWAIVPSENAGELNIVNAATETALRRAYMAIIMIPMSNYTLDENSSKEGALPITLEYDEVAGNTIIRTGAATAIDNGSSTLVQYDQKLTSGWTFELVAVEKNDELYHKFTAISEILVDAEKENVAEEDSTYDLFGRKVLTPVKNTIYIKNGEKVIIK